MSRIFSMEVGQSLQSPLWHIKCNTFVILDLSYDRLGIGGNSTLYRHCKLAQTAVGCASLVSRTRIPLPSLVWGQPGRHLLSLVLGTTLLPE